MEERMIKDESEDTMKTKLSQTLSGKATVKQNPL